MKKTFLLIMFFVLPSFCFGGITMKNVSTSGNVFIDKVPALMFVGDSNTVGWGDVYTNTNGTWVNISGYRDNLMNQLGKWSRRVVGDRGFGYEAEDDNSTHMIGFDQSRHFSWNGETAIDVTFRLGEEPLQHETWFPYSNDKHLIIIMLGTNDLQIDQSETSQNNARDAIGDYIDIIEGYDSTINIFICLIPPHINTTINDAIISYNSKLEVMVAGKAKSNLSTVDIYSELIDCWSLGPQSCTSEGLHMNPNGYELIANLINDTMKRERIR